MDLVNNIDFISPGHGNELHILPEGPDLIDPAVRSAVDLNNIQVGIQVQGFTGDAGPDPVQFPGQYASTGGFAGPPGTAEKVSMVDPVIGQRDFKTMGDLFLSDDIVE
jgi:hypothetical protein